MAALEQLEFQVSLDDVVLGQVIGRGAFSEVSVGDYFGDAVAVKRQSLDSDADTPETAMLRELTILRSVSHPNLIEYVGASMVSDPQLGRQIYILTELMPNGDLLELLLSTAAEHEQLGVALLVSIAVGAARGLCYLHQHGIIHRHKTTRGRACSGGMDGGDVSTTPCRCATDYATPPLF